MKFYKYLLLVSVLALQACSDPAEKANNFIQNGKKYFENQQYDKAALEFKNALQIDNKLAEAFYYLGLLEEKKQNWQAMFAALSQAVKLAPNHVQALLKLAQLKLLSGNAGEARQDVEKALAIEPNNVEALSIKGAVMLKQGNKNEAIALVDQALRLAPGHIDAVSLKTAIFTEDKDYKSALALIDATLKDKPNEVTLYLLKAQVHASLKDVAAQEQDYRDLVKQFPDNLDFQYALAKFYSENQREPDADTVLNNVIAKHPADLKAKLIYIEYLKQKKPESAVAKLREFITQQPESADLYLLLAKSLIAHRQFSEAKEPLNWLVEHKKDEKEGLLAKVLEAALALQENNSAEAEKLLNEVLAVDARHYDAMLLKAKMKLVANKVDDAIADLRNILRDYPDKDEAMVLMAKAYIRQNAPELADENFRKALEVNPKNFDAIMPVVAKMIASKDITRAEEVLTKALQINPDHAGALQALAQVRLLKKDWLGTQKVADLIATKSQGAGFAKYLSAKISQAQGQCEPAVSQYREALALTPTLSDALNGMSACYEALKQRETMLSYLDEFSRAHPEIDLATVLRAQLLVLDKHVDDALALLSKAIAAKPKATAFYELTAQILIKEKQTDKAIANIQQGLLSNPDSPQLLMILASIYEQESDYQHALATYETLIAKQPNIDVAVNNLVSILLDRFDTPENISRAAKLAERFKDSKQPYFIDSYAWSLFKAGKKDEALQVLKRVVDLASDVPVFHYHLGAVYAAKGDKKKASDELKQALALGERTGQFAEKEQADKLLQGLGG